MIVIDMFESAYRSGHDSREFSVLRTVPMRSQIARGKTKLMLCIDGGQGEMSNATEAWARICQTPIHTYTHTRIHTHTHTHTHTQTQTYTTNAATGSQPFYHSVWVELGAARTKIEMENVPWPRKGSDL
jgi:hypothetical protein